MEAVSTEGTSGVLIIHHFAEGFRGSTFALRLLAICLFIHKRYRFQVDPGRHRAPHIRESGISKRVSTTRGCLAYFFIRAILVIVQELNGSCSPQRRLLSLYTGMKERRKMETKYEGKIRASE